MKAYIISIAVSSVICAVINMITPENWSKYISVVTGLVITVCIAQPIISIISDDGIGEIEYTAKEHRTDGETVLYDEIKEELEKRINEDARQRLKTDFGRNCEVSSVVKMNNGAVSGVKSINISGDKIDAVIIGKMREIYGADEVKYVGTEKSTKKSE